MQLLIIDINIYTVYLYTENINGWHNIYLWKVNFTNSTFIEVHRAWVNGRQDEVDNIHRRFFNIQPIPFKEPVDYKRYMYLVYNCSLSLFDRIVLVRREKAAQSAD